MKKHIKTITFGSIPGALKVLPEKIDEIVNKALDDIEQQGGMITDIQISRGGSSNDVLTFLIIFNDTK